MDQKPILILVGTLAVLLVAAWLSGFFGGSPSTVETPELTLAAQDIQAITIRRGGDLIEVVRSTDGEWRLETPVDADVDTTTSTRLLTGLENLRIESLVSSRTDRYVRFQVDSAQATYIRLEGKEVVELYVGKTGPDFQSRYIRLGNDEQVYLASGVPTTEPNLDRWKDKRLWSYPKEQISGVSASTPESKFRLLPSDSGWTLEDGETSTLADSAKVHRYLGRLATVNADGFLLDIDRESVADSATYTVEIQWFDGSVSRLRMMKRGNDAAAIEDGSDDVVKFSSYRVATLAPEPSELLPE